MKLTYLRGACVVLETQDCRIMCDPWLCDGPYYGAWAHFPPFTGDDWQLKCLCDIDFVYVSHIHPDHFDILTLQHLKTIWGSSRLPTVLIYSYPQALKVLRNQILDLGFEVEELAHGVLYSRGRTRISIFSADGCDPQACGAFYGCAMPGVIDTQIDSLAVIQDDHHTVVNVNDCPYGLSKTLCEKIGAQFDVDLALIAYAGAGPFPQCFAMPDENKLKLAHANNQRFIKDVAGFAHALRAKRVLPFAGDYQLCGSLVPLNEFRGVPTISEVFHSLNANDITVFPSVSGVPYPVDWHHGGCVFINTDVGRKAYVAKELAGRKLDYENDAVPDKDIEFLWADAFHRFDGKRTEYGLQCSSDVYVKNGDAFFYIPPDGPWSVSNEIDRSRPFVSISTDRRLLARLLSGPRWGHWNNAQIGSHIMFERQPLMNYEPGLYHLLSYLHA